jgi:DNA-binding transcriptional ArsR family regulator
LKDPTKLFKALSNEHRLAIFQYLRRHDLSCDDPDAGCTVGEIAKRYDLALSTVSHHLKELKEADLIRCEQRGQYTYCVVNPEQVEALRGFFSTEH